MSDSLRPHELYSSWNSLSQSTGVGSLSLLQGNHPNPEIEPKSPTLHMASLPADPQGKPKNTEMGIPLEIPTQDFNQGLQHGGWILYQLSYQGSPYQR